MSDGRLRGLERGAEQDPLLRVRVQLEQLRAGRLDVACIRATSVRTHAIVDVRVGSSPYAIYPWGSFHQLLFRKSRHNFVRTDVMIRTYCNGVNNYDPRTLSRGMPTCKLCLRSMLIHLQAEQPLPQIRVDYLPLESAVKVTT